MSASVSKARRILQSAAILLADPVPSLSFLSNDETDVYRFVTEDRADQ